MSTRWRTGWVILPSTLKTPIEYAHRPHPDRPKATVCDRVTGGRPVHSKPPDRVPLCPRCEGKAKRGSEREAARKKKIDEWNRKVQEQQYLARVQKYGGHLPGSVYAYRAGLPGLGRRR